MRSTIVLQKLLRYYVIMHSNEDRENNEATWQMAESSKISCTSLIKF